MLGCLRTDVRGWMAGTGAIVEAGMSVGVVGEPCGVWGVEVGSACPDAFSTLVGAGGVGEVRRTDWFVSSRTSWVSHTMGLPSCFLPAPNPYVAVRPPEIHRNRFRVAYIPCWRGEAKVVASW